MLKMESEFCMELETIMKDYVFFVKNITNNTNNLTIVPVLSIELDKFDFEITSRIKSETVFIINFKYNSKRKTMILPLNKIDNLYSKIIIDEIKSKLL